MESTNNNNQLLLSKFKELENEFLAMKKRIVQLEKSHEKQQERLDTLERENHTMKTELNNLNGIKENGSLLKRKRTDQAYEEEAESKPASASTSADKKKTKTNNNDEVNEAVVISRPDNGDSFDSLSDDLLHKIVEFDGNCYSKFGSINKRCRNIYDVEEYKLKKQTCVYGYGTVDMMLQHYLQKKKRGTLDELLRHYIAQAVIIHNRFDVIDWIIQLEDIDLLQWVCLYAAWSGRINILSKVFLNSNVTTLSYLLHNISLCYNAAMNGKLETLKWLRNHGCSWNADTFAVARRKGHDEIVQYLRLEGCPERDESLGSEQV